MSTTKRISNGCQRRFLAGNMILNGATNDEVIDALDVSLSSVKRWRKKIDGNSLDGLVRKSGSGRPCRLSAIQIQKLKILLRGGARSCGYDRDRWTTKIVADLIFRQFHVRYHFNHVGKILRKLSFRPVMTVRKSKKHDPAKVEHWIRYACPPKNVTVKKSHKNDWPILFWDESNFSLVPIIARTWAEHGQVPILYESEKRRTRSRAETGVGYITLTPKRRTPHFYLTIYPGSANTDEIVFDLDIVHRHYQRTVVIVWDGLPAHKGAERHFRVKHPDWFVFHTLPAYSPELNPVEQCWNEMKNHLLGNFVADNVHVLREAALAAATNVDKRSGLLLPKFFKHSRLRL